MARRQRLPGQYHTTFRVDVSEPGVSRGDDGRTQQEWFEAGGMMATTTYIGDLERVDGRWSLAIQWIDSTNTAHKYFMPHELVTALKSAMERVTKRSLSDRAKHAAQTRQDNGIVPFERREETA